jgi:hypothetical protein
MPTGEMFEVTYGAPVAGKGHHDLVERVVVRSWDERRIRRYEQRVMYDLTHRQEGTITTVAYQMRREEEQIEGP